MHISTKDEIVLVSKLQVRKVIMCYRRVKYNDHMQYYGFAGTKPEIDLNFDYTWLLIV